MESNGAEQYAFDEMMRREKWYYELGLRQHFIDQYGRLPVDDSELFERFSPPLANSPNQ